MQSRQRSDERCSGLLRFLLTAAAALSLIGSLPQGFGTGTLTAQPAKESALKTVVIPVEGMACVACAASVKRALKAIDGVSEVEVNLEKRSARVTYAAGKVTAERLAAAINRLGYRAGTPREAE